MRGSLAVLLALGALLLVCSVDVFAVTIVDYTVTSITSSELAALPADHWAQYVSQCHSSAPTRTIPLKASLNRIFVNISGSGMRVPFYAYNSTPFHVNNLGFLSPTWYGMCDGYCVRDMIDPIKGNYGFSNDTSVFFQGGGDWPMIAFYLAPFDTFYLGSEDNFIVTQEHFAPMKIDGISNASAVLTDTLVEYCNVPLQGLSSSTAAGLTAQVVVHVNGTIVMRYRTLPPATALPEYVRSTGLIYSVTLRKVVATPTAANGIVAYRFDPVYDACDGAATAAACAERSTTLDAVGSTAGAAGGVADCAWCAATSACASRKFAAEVCPRGEWAVTADAGSSAVPQKFYNVTVDLTPQTFIDLSNMENLSYTRLTSGYVTVDRPIRLFNRPANTTPRCIAGFSCPTTETDYSCALVQNTCVDGSYSFALLALESTFAFDFYAVAKQAELRSRSKGTVWCEDDGGCAAATVVQVTGVGFKNGYTTWPGFTVQVYLESTGIIDIVVRCTWCPDGAPFLAYPPIRMGLVRYGVSDPSTVLVPQSLLRSGVHVRFVPQTSCADCGLHGSCDEATRQCGCVAGFYGAGCRACPVCWAGSRCEDGVEGSGACVCADAACKATCGGAAPERSCVGCSAAGGRCECGTCVCVDGWTGANCEVPPEDACRAYSLDGCAVCGQHAGCAMCHDSVCYNTSLAGTASGYLCSYSTSAADTRACRTYAEAGFELPAGDGSLSKSSIALVVFAVYSGCIVGAYLFSCAKTSKAPNPATAIAHSSAAKFENTTRHRTVLPGSFLRQRHDEAPMTAIPLKQLSLKRLFQRRMGKGPAADDES